MKLTRGERFKDARTVYNQRGKQTMDEVTAATGVSKSLIQSLEDDDVARSVGYDKVAKLAAHYGVTADFLLGLSDDPNPAPSTVNDLGLSVKAVEMIESLDLLDTPNYQILFGDSVKYAKDIFNCLLESKDFMEIMGDLMLCFDAFQVAKDSRAYEAEDFEREAEMRGAGYAVLHGEDAARFYAGEAAEALKKLVYQEFPRLVEDCTKSQ